MRLLTGRLRLPDTELFWRGWVPEASPLGTVVIAHGACEHTGRYAALAESLGNRGFAVFGFDRRGHGLSPGPRALLERMDQAVADVDAFVGMVRDEQPAKPIFVLGHSLGGTIALEYTLAHQDALSGLILSAPAVAPSVSLVQMRLARLLSWIAPRLRMVTLQAGRMSGDPAVIEAYCADPLIYRGKVPVRTLVEVLGTVRRLPARLPDITVPVLLLHGTADELAAPSGSQLVYDTVGSAAKKRIFYEGLPHELFHDPACARVLSDMTCWLEGRLPAASPQRSEPR